MISKGSSGLVNESQYLVEEFGTNGVQVNLSAVDDDFDFDFAPGHLIRRAQQVHTSVWASVVGEELTSPQFAVLNVLYECPWINQTTLSNLASLDTSTCQDIVSRLRQKGLVVRARDASDGRRWLLKLSDKGVRTRDDVLPKVKEVGDLLLSSLTSGDRADFTRLLYEVAKRDSSDLVG